MNQPHSYVEAMCDLFERRPSLSGGQPPVPSYRFVLEHGREFVGTRWTAFRGNGYRMMRSGRCFQNAFLMMLVRPELAYYEGYASAQTMSVHHAWCVDQQQRVVDATWRRSRLGPEEKWEYFGVGFDRDQLLARGTASEWMQHSWSVLCNLDYDSDLRHLLVGESAVPA